MVSEEDSPAKWISISNAENDMMRSEVKKSDKLNLDVVEIGKIISVPSSSPRMRNLPTSEPASNGLKKTPTQGIPKRTLTSKAMDRVFSDEGTEVTQEEKEAELAEINSQKDEDFLSVSTRKKQLKPSSSGMQKMMQTHFMRKLTSLSTVSSDVMIDAVSKFILLKVVVDYLANDLEMALNVCCTNLSYVANSAIFEGNILRLKALTLEGKYEQEIREIEERSDDDEEQEPKKEEDIVPHIVEALEATLNACSVFSDSRKLWNDKSKPNRYGMALADF